VSNLEAEYAAATSIARAHLRENYSLLEVDPPVIADDPRSWRAVWRIELSPGAPVPSLLIAIPWLFPDELPHVFLTSRVAGVPHLDHKLELCTFDRSEASANGDDPGGVVSEVLLKALSILANPGGREEYYDEFQAYWIEGGGGIPGLSTITVSPPDRTVVMVDIRPPLGIYRKLFADDVTSAERFLQHVDRTMPKTMDEVLYLYGIDTGVPPVLLTNFDVYHAVPSGPQRVALEAYLQRVPRPTTVLFSPMMDAPVLASWSHGEYVFEAYAGKSGVRRHRHVAPGFRNGHLPASIELTSKYGHLPLTRAIVARADAERLHARSGGDEPRSFLRTANVVGCGSVGSIVADVLRHFGTTRMRLVDKELLDPHNIARHLCGMNEVGQLKAEAVARAVGRHAPHVDIDPIGRNVLDVLRDDPQRLDMPDVTIIAIAETATERRLNRHARAGTLGRLCFTWVEPYMAAGHFLIVDPAATGCLECTLSPDGAFEHAVVENGRSHMRRDAGCGGSFTPYAGIDVQRFVASAIPAVAKLLSEGGSHLLTVIGDLTAAQDRGAVIAERWAQESSFSLHSEQVTPRVMCAVCGAA
jgi:hypothetical protein